MLITQKVRIFPDARQQEVLWVLSERCRLIYNFALAERIDNWKENREKTREERTHVTYHQQSAQLPSLKEKYPEYRWVYSKVLQVTLQQLDWDYRSFFALWKKGDVKA